MNQPPQPERHVELAELLSALSYALDITEGQPAGHSVRCCWIGMRIGAELGLGPELTNDLYYTLLLKDVGCSSNAARICQLYITDDREFKRAFKTVNSSLPDVLRFVFQHTGLKAGLAERFRTILKVAANGGEIARELIETRCQRGADIVRQMRFSEAVAKGILDLDEHWNGSGLPLGSAGTEISLLARIALVTQVVDVFHTSSGVEQARREIRQRSGTWFDPEVAAALGRIGDDPEVWSALRAPDLQKRVVALEQSTVAVIVADDYLDDIAAAFAEIIDAKSPYTSGHSNRVALFTDLIAEELGQSEAQRAVLKRAALLHDIGKLGVSNEVLDKPGKLDPTEWGAIRRHPADGELILLRIAALSDLARIAGAHHERLDGGGYPRGLRGEDINLETRIVTTADIFDALTADRPYRKAMPVSEAFAIMQAMVGTAIDAGCFAALQRAMGRVEEIAA